jgi:PAS domain S-box-containing protein
MPANRDLLAAIVDASADAIISKTLDGVITSWNAGATALYGYAPEEMIGKPVSLLLPPGHPNELPGILARLCQGERVAPYLTQRVRKDGALVDVSLTVSPLRDAAGRLVGASAIARDLTAQRRAGGAPERSRAPLGDAGGGESPRDTNAFLEYVFSAIHVMLAYMDRDFNFIRVNRAYAEADGHPPEYFVGKNHFALYPNPENEAVFRRVVETGLPYVAIARPFVHPGHPERGMGYWDWLLQPVREGDGRVEGLVLSVLDVTERTAAAERVRAASEYARSLIEASLDPLVTISPEGKITDVNQATEEASGLPRDALIGTDFADYFTEPDRARAGYRRVLAEGHVRDYPLTIRHRDGRTMDVLYHATVYRNAAGELQGVFAAARDVTEQRRAAERARAASEYARSLIEASLDPLVTISPEGKVTDVNHATEEATGRSRAALIGTDFADYFTEPDRARAGYRRVLAEGRVRDYPLTLRHQDGRTIDVLYNATVYRNAAGELQGVFAAARDVTERNRAERALRRYAERLAVLYQVDKLIAGTLEIRDIHDALVALLARIIPVDRTAVVLIHEAEGVWEATKVWSRGTPVLRPGQRSPLAGSVVEHVMRTGRPLLEREIGESGEWPENRMLRAEGLRSRVLLPLRIEGRVVGLLTAASAVPEAYAADDLQILEPIADQLAIGIHRSSLYAQLRAHAAELEERVAHRTAELEQTNRELEAFTYSVSHDLRSPLRSLDGFSLAVLEDCRDRLDQRSADYLRRIRGASQRMGQLIDDLLRLSRLGRAPLQREPVDLSALAAGVCRELAQAHPDRAVEYLVAPGITGRGDSRLLRIVLENLLGNAWKFTSKHPTARIEFGAHDKDGCTAYFVRDDGAGFDVTYADRLFSPFQRLHAVTDFEGTGVGLATVQRIVHRHGGRCWAEGAVERGATVWFTLP